MSNTKDGRRLISIIIPVMNEEQNIAPIYSKLKDVFANLHKYSYEIIYVDDGSTDASVKEIEALEAQDPAIRTIRLARNFGKEIATTAGLHASKGEAAIMIDADLQHPPELIPEFLKCWEEGYDVVIGKQMASSSYASFIKRLTSKGFYKVINAISSVEITAHATDFRLLDRSVVDEFNRFTERNRMTRGLIDWLGFSRIYIEFTPAKRAHGVASYSYRGLIRLAIDSTVSMSFFPLRIAGYLGIFIAAISGPLGLVVLFDRVFLNNSMRFTGTADLALLVVFLIGIVLICLGLIALYIANIYGEVVNRPLYVEKRRQPRA